MKSYIVVYVIDGRVLRSLRYGLEADAIRRLKVFEERGHKGVIERSFLPPQVFPHCPGSGSAAIGSVCDLCGKILTVEDARKWKEKI